MRKKWRMLCSRRCLGIIIADTYAGLVETRHFTAGTKVASFALLPLAAREKADFTAGSEYWQYIFTKLVADSGCSAGKVVIACDNEHVKLQEITLPLMERQELKEALKWEIKKYVPYDDNQYYYDFLVASCDEAKHEQIVLVAAAEKQFVDDLAIAACQAGLRLCGITVAGVVIGNAVDNAGCQLLWTVCAAKSQVQVLRDGRLLLSRKLLYSEQALKKLLQENLGFSLQEITAMLAQPTSFRAMLAQNPVLEKAVAALWDDAAAELRRTIDYCASHFGLSVDKVSLFGCSRLLSLSLAASLPVPVVPAMPLPHFKLEKGLDETIFSEYWQFLAGAAGAADGSTKLSINLLPCGFSRTSLCKSAACVVAGLAVVAVLGSVAFNSWQIYVLERQCEELSTQKQLLAPLQAVQDETEAMQRSLRIREEAIAGLAKSNVSAYAVLARCGVCVPADTILQEVKFSYHDGIVFKGYAAKMSIVAQFLDNLQNDGYFASPVLQSVVDNKGDGVEFSINAKLKRM